MTPRNRQERGAADRAARRARWETLFTGGALFAAGLIMMAAFLFNPSTILRVPQFLLFWFYAWLSGRKSRPLITLPVMLGIIIFNLLAPYGRVLAEFGVFRITQGSLFSGLRKALTLEGLVMLSGAMIRRDLRLPGALGRLIGDSFRLLRRISERKGLITRQDPIGGIDRLLLELSVEQEAWAEEGESLRPDPKRPVCRGLTPGQVMLAAAALPVIALSLYAWVKKVF